MGALETFLIYGIDWRLQAVGGLVAIGGLAIVLVRLLGLKLALKVLAGIGAVYSALVYGRRERQQGRADAIAQGERDAQKALDRAAAAQRAARDQYTSRPDRLRDNDGYRRD